MRILTAMLTAVALAVLTSCSVRSADSSPAPEPAESNSPAVAFSSPPATLIKLEPVWVPKLQAASAGAVEACMMPSSSTCARSLSRIMSVVDELDTAIDETGKRYPQSTAQIVEMQDEYETYVSQACQGDPEADDPSGRCWGIATITVGVTTLQMTLVTDDLVP
jgi:hypothetical protein